MQKQTASYNRRDFIKMGAAVTATAAAAGLAGGCGSGKKPNIVYVFSDEHRWCSLPFTEMPELKTPHMSRLAQQSTRFDNCVSTSPICIPYRAVMMTGLLPHQSTYYSNDYYENTDVIGISAPTAGQVFKNAGYTTGYVGKWHLDNKTCAQAGFDYFQHWLYGDEHWKTQVRDIAKGEDFHTVEGYNATGMTNQALEFISAHAHDPNPFFLMLSINPPHWRWDDAPEEFVKMYPDGTLEKRPNVMGDKYTSDREKLFYQHYHAHISAIDRELGRLMDDLEKQGVAEDTVLIYTSDHGSSFGSQGVGSKGNPYEEAVRVPFMVRWPGKIKKGAVRMENIGTPDMLPTLCGLAGIEPPAACMGHDFSPTLRGEDGPDPDGQLIMVNNFQRNYFKREIEGGEITWFQPFRGVRTRQYTFVVSQDGDWLLYDNENDPYQMKNLVDDPAYKEKKEELRHLLHNLLARAEEPFIPEEWKKLPLPERIAAEARHFSVMPYKKQWDDYKTEALKPWLAKMPEKKAALEKAADTVFDEVFFGRYKALHNGVHGKNGTGKRRWTDLKPAEVQKMLDAHEKKYAALFKKEIGKIN